jgi:hypothetical protein
MVRFIRYALATFCFAASVGCLALWWRSYDTGDVLQAPSGINSRLFNEIVFVTSFRGRGNIATGSNHLVIGSPPPLATWDYSSRALDSFPPAFGLDRYSDGSFGRIPNGVYFPIWYPALIFGLAGVGILRFRRQFSIRSALICVSVVAALLGMVVAL